MSDFLAHHILIFDSGVGGFSIVNAIKAETDSVYFSYLVDDALFPFGDKSKTLLLQRSQRLFKQAIALTQPDLIVIACNTASTLILPSLRQFTSIPIIGVVPAIKPAAELSQSRKIGLLATQSTLNNSYITQLKNQFAQDCQLIKFDAQPLVTLCEKYFLTGDNINNELEHWIASLKEKETDINILGCTHFPLIKQQLEAYWPRPVKWIDSGIAIAERTKFLLAKKQILLNTQAQLLFTQPQVNQSLFNKLNAIGIQHYQQLKCE